MLTPVSSSVFTGIVQAVGVLKSVDPTAAGVRLIVAAEGWPPGPPALAIGESIAVGGCCLTLAAVGDHPTRGLAFDVVPETLAKTTLGGLAVGGRVNLERSLAAGDLLGGHMVQGHVDGVGVVERVKRDGEWRVTIRGPDHLAEYLSPKGSIAVDGVSLTLAAVHPPTAVFEVALIPVTLEKTTLGGLREGDRVNLEADAFAKTIVHWLRHHLPLPEGGGWGKG